MKKILSLLIIMLSFAGSSFADTAATTAGGQTIKGGADSTAAANAATPLIKFSTGVFGLVNFVPDTAAKTCLGYVIATRHSTGSKNFATANDITNIYWKQAAVGTGTAALLLADVTNGTASGTVFAAGNGWTSY